LIAKKYVIRNRNIQTVKTAAGGTFPLELNWRNARQTLILVLRQDCEFCAESMAFYRQLVAISADAQVPVVALTPEEPEAARRYLSQEGLHVSEIRQAELRPLGILGTPVIYLVDDTGTIQEEWRGKLTAAKEKEVLNLLSANSQVSK
jgi:peroxiredoxin